MFDLSPPPLFDFYRSPVLLLDIGPRLFDPFYSLIRHLQNLPRLYHQLGPTDHPQPSTQSQFSNMRVKILRLSVLNRRTSDTIRVQSATRPTPVNYISVFDSLL